MKSIKNFSVNKKRNNWLKILIGAVVFLFLIFVINIFTSPIKNIFYTLSYPVQKTFWSAGGSSSSFLGSLLNAGSLAKENEKLNQENQKLLVQIASLQSIEQANQAQTNASISCQNSGFKSVMAGVIGLDSKDILSINKGSANGISQDMPVVDQNNVLFGKVFKVYKNFSEVMLISNKSSVINVKISSYGRSPEGGQPPAPEIDGVVKGSGGLGAYLDSVQIQDNINQGDVLTTSSLDGIFPKDLLVGKINKVEKNDQKPFQQAQISLSFNIKTADNLFVITNYKR